tara:strand:+ start:2405 stop:2632 length:228 start_codon:yes stop_codon:yes gene_type:complete
MKELFENFRKLIEGEVVQFPQESKVSEEDLQKIIKLENFLGDELGKIYGQQSSIPTDVLYLMDEFVNLVETSLKK